MKKIYSLLLTLAVAGSLSLSAQQLPNAGFEESWTDCVPWTSKGNTSKQGTTPSPWIVSNTVGTGTMGKTTIATKVTGHNSNSAVELKAGSQMGKNIPGYMSLGTAWSTAKGVAGANADGGTFGGYDFKYRPDAVSFYYKRAENTGEKSTVVVYAWKGSWSQASVPGNIVVTGSPKTATMTDRERNILGMNTSQGGTVTPSADAELIASTTHYISDTQADWANLEIPIEYKSTSAPTKFNVIFAAGEYFESAPKTNGKSFTIDDVTLLYYSRLASLSINGAPVAGFDSNTYSYTINADMPDESAFAFTCLGNSGSGKATLSLDKANSTATITVTNSNAGGTDYDGQASHVYTVKFEKAQGGDVEIGDDAYGIYKGIVTVHAIEAGLGEEDINRNGNVHIINNGKNNGTCTFKLPDFALDDTTEGYIGDIVVENVNIRNAEGGGYTINGFVNPLTLKMGENDIVAKVTVEGTISLEGVATMNIDVIWLMDPEGDPEGTEYGVTIGVEFNGQKEGGETPEKPVYGGDIYKGDVTVLAVEAGLGEEDIVRPGEVHIIADENAPSKCTLALPDFALDDTADGYIGDIVVPGLTVTEVGGTKRYEGSINPLNLKMAGNDIIAKVTVDGTIDANGTCTMNISVIWLMDPENDPEGTEAGVPINVLFNGQFFMAGIDDIPVDNTNAPVEYYNLKGMRIDGSNLAPGVYIRRQGTDVKKILVK